MKNKWYTKDEDAVLMTRNHHDGKYGVEVNLHIFSKSAQEMIEREVVAQEAQYILELVCVWA
jgi:hypothetical protein